MRYIVILCMLGIAHLYGIGSREIKKKNIAYLAKKGQKEQNSALLRAIDATNRLHAKYRNPGLSQKEFLQTAYYIESHKSQIAHKKKHYFSRGRTGLPADIEYDPVTKNTFVVLRNKKSFIGKGVKKRVHKAIHYNHGPKVLARSEQILEMDSELKAHKALRGARGVMNTHAFTTHKRNKKRYYSIYSDLYDGTLNNLFENGGLTFKNKLIIMSDLLHGLESIHNRGFAHRDLHSYNYLVHAETQLDGSKLWRAVIADLGRTEKVAKLKGEVAQMNRRMSAPEAFKFQKLQKRDYQKTDIYSLGCIFYRLFFNRYPHWQDGLSKYVSAGKNRYRLVKKLKKATVRRRKSLYRRRGMLSSRERAELLILKMVHVNPNKRGTARSLQKQLQQILH